MANLKESERLDKVLANEGFGTRKEVKRIIHSGAVVVNGESILQESAHVNVYKDEIVVEGKKLETKRNYHFMMNKAAGYVCSTKSDSHKIVYDLLSDEDARRFVATGSISMVGRLDADTEGLLILTTDGNLNHRLTSPKYNIPKKYQVTLRDSVDGKTQEDYTARVAAGIHIAAEGKAPEADCRPAVVEWKSSEVCFITVTEGMFHEVKRIFAALGNEVIHLKRVQINGLVLDPALASGEYRELTEEELSVLDVQPIV
ncbi:rRNA pseudouridine synthase [Treponema rectale]|uniref:Pseudouridine synthase n=1 Tax=Treponema rectale TaxID=744512 RepID=A0A840S7R4_9SPIR|nr:pseudouridine synthase [Treponema rectale]MBB5217697.1 16S rRNA pseudouridine516 synthase [Treponema rectale]QOS40572.1 rRNA pseudouridine synthase [Treponema rectale]